MKTKGFGVWLASLSLAVLLAIGCEAEVDAQENASPPANTAANTDKWLSRVQEGHAFEVFRNWADVPQHKGALITIVQTDNPGNDFGLTFMQRREQGHRGKGMICPESQRLRKKSSKGVDDAYKCHQHMGSVAETLTIGLIPSEFCDSLRDSEENKTADDKNPIATEDECKAEYPDGACVCFQIRHERDPDLPAPNTNPPTDGSGSGGRGP